MKVEFIPSATSKHEQDAETQYLPIGLDAYDPPIAIVREVLTQESYVLTLAQTEERLSFEQAEPCEFEVRGGPSPHQVPLLLMPLVGRVLLRIESALVGSNHWSASPLLTGITGATEAQQHPPARYWRLLNDDDECSSKDMRWAIKELQFGDASGFFAPTPAGRAFAHSESSSAKAETLYQQSKKQERKQR